MSMPMQNSAEPGWVPHLRVLSICHYVFAALGVCGLGFIGFHYAMMSTMMNSPEFRNGPNPPPEGFFDMFMWMYAAFVLMFLVGMTLNFLAGLWLNQRKNWMFCVIIAGLNCIQFPLGTVLGVFTLITLTKDPVRQSFR